MSASQLSDVVVRRIIRDFNTRLFDDKRNPIALLNDEVRDQTNKNQDGIVSESSLEILKSQFGRAYTIASTRKKFIKQDVEKYKNYPAVYAYLNGQTDTQEALKDLVQETVKMLSTKNLFNDFFSWYQDTYGNLVEQRDSSGKVTGFIAKGMEHREFNSRFKQFLLSKSFAEKTVEFFDANTDAGHFIGVFNIKFAKIFDLSIENVNNFSDFTVSFNPNITQGLQGKDLEDAEKLRKSFEEILKLLAEADAVSSNLLPDLDLVVRTSKEVYGSKNNPLSSISFELSYLNTRAGRKINGIGRRIKNLAEKTKRPLVDAAQQEKTSDFKRELGELFKTTSKLGEYIEELGSFYDRKLRLDPVQKKIIDDLRSRSAIIVQNLVTASGSDSIIDSIAKTVANTIAGKKIPSKQYTAVKGKETYSAGGIDPKKKDFKAPKVATNKQATVQSPVKKKINLNLQAKAGVTKAVAPSLFSLQNLLNLKLQQVVRDNMGTGNRRDVLNYRSGRFVDSIEVTNVSAGRSGAITAFYTYMKNPYATFSQGGKQQYPRTRDPKTLISKSIRQVAQELAVNRLRTVLV
jgi:hypothetical protein